MNEAMFEATGFIYSMTNNQITWIEPFGSIGEIYCSVWLQDDTTVTVYNYNWDIRKNRTCPDITNLCDDAVNYVSISYQK